MRTAAYLALASLACFGFAGANLVLNEGMILPGWILLGVIFAAIAAAAVVFGGDDAPDAAEA